MINSEDIHSMRTAEKIIVRFDEPVWSVCSDKVNAELQNLINVRMLSDCPHSYLNSIILGLLQPILC